MAILVNFIDNFSILSKIPKQSKTKQESIEDQRINRSINYINLEKQADTQTL